jgi:hypothetical protein
MRSWQVAFRLGTFKSNKRVRALPMRSDGGWHQSNGAMFNPYSGRAGGRRDDSSYAAAEVLWAAKYMLG